MFNQREVVLCFFIFVSIGGYFIAGNPEAIFSQEELKFFASLGLCGHFGGECGSVCPHRFITHKWGVPLCQDDVLLRMECCIGPAPTGVTESMDELITTSTAAPLPVETFTDKVTASEEEDNTDCGLLKIPHARRKRIVGGQLASSDYWPWLVAFRSMMGSHACSGAVIDQRWVITAAHCFKYISNPSLWRVRIGEYNLKLKEVGERDINILEILLYPDYTPLHQLKGTNQTLNAKYVHDIALVHLSQDALTEPLCLPHSGDDSFLGDPELSHDTDNPKSSHSKQAAAILNEIDAIPNIEGHMIHRATNENDEQNFNVIPVMGFSEFIQLENGGVYHKKPELMGRSGTCWVAGWGLTLDADIKDHVLREVSGNILGSEECSKMWGEPLDKEMLCFGDGTYGPCAGDSGGPLSCERDGRYYLMGVVSWGTEECNISGYPSVFTNLQPYLSWIHQEIHSHR